MLPKANFVKGNNEKNFDFQDMIIFSKKILSIFVFKFYFRGKRINIWCGLRPHQTKQRSVAASSTKRASAWRRLTKTCLFLLQCSLQCISVILVPPGLDANTYSPWQFLHHILNGVHVWGLSWPWPEYPIVICCQPCCRCAGRARPRTIMKTLHDFI